MHALKRRPDCILKLLQRDSARRHSSKHATPTHLAKLLAQKSSLQKAQKDECEELYRIAARHSANSSRSNRPRTLRCPKRRRWKPRSVQQPPLAIIQGARAPLENGYVEQL